MFSAVAGSYLSVMDNLSLQYKALQANAILARAAMHQKNFALTLPAQLGALISAKSTDDLLTLDQRVLHKFKNRSDFEGTSRLHCPKDNILDQVKNAKKVLAQKESEWGTLGAIAKDLATYSYEFLSEPFTFLTNEVNYLNKQKGEETKKAHWTYVSYVICQIFHKIHLIHQYGMDSSPVIHTVFCLP